MDDLINDILNQASTPQQNKPAAQQAQRDARDKPVPQIKAKDKEYEMALAKASMNSQLVMKEIVKPGPKPFAQSSVRPTKSAGPKVKTKAKHKYITQPVEVIKLNQNKRDLRSIEEIQRDRRRRSLSPDMEATTADIEREERKTLRLAKQEDERELIRHQKLKK